MSVMAHKAGTALQTGATECPVQGTHTQTDSKAAAGELKMYYKADGSDLSAYVSDPHQEMEFDAVIESSIPDKEIGDLVTVQGGSYLVTKWIVNEDNKDVKKVSIGLRSTSLEAPSSGGGSQGGESQGGDSQGGDSQGGDSQGGDSQGA